MGINHIDAMAKGDRIGSYFDSSPTTGQFEMSLAQRECGFLSQRHCLADGEQRWPERRLNRFAASLICSLPCLAVPSCAT